MKNSMDNLEIVNSDLKSINLGNLKTVEFDLVLPTKGKMGTTITWETSDDRWITSFGKVNRPGYGRGNRIVILTASITEGEITRKREFEVNILQEGNNIKVVKVYPVKLIEKVNTDFYLPSAVAIKADDGRIISHLVEWDVPTLQRYEQSGNYKASGKIKDTKYKFTADIIVDETVKFEKVLPQVLKTVSLESVSLTQGTPFFEAQQNRLAFLLNVNDDQMLYNFRSAANMDTLGAPEMIGWDAPNSLLKGHTTGHYLSALAKCYAVTNNKEILNKINYMVQELKKVQEKFTMSPKVHEGFLSGYTEDQFDLLEQYKPYPEIWAPYYTLHKILAGLLDIYDYEHNQEALNIAKKIGYWTYNRLNKLSHDKLVKMWGMYIAGEFGGMNDSLARLTEITGDEIFVQCAKLFDNDKLMFPLLENVDALNGMHANQHIPQVIGWLRIFNVTHEEKYYIAAKRFWNFVVNNHTYSIGGVGNGEMFHAPNDISEQLGKDTAETCATYNMLKLTEFLFKYEPIKKYMDYYEHATFNHILATTPDNQNGESTYFMPTGTGQHKEFDDENSCCHGTGLENHFMYNSTIYSKSEDALLINLLISSRFSDTQHNVNVDLKEEIDEIHVTIQINKLAESKLKIRLPKWGVIKDIEINGQEILAKRLDEYIEFSIDNQESLISFNLKKKLLIIPTDKNSLFSIQYGPSVLVNSDKKINEMKLSKNKLMKNEFTLDDSLKECLMPLYKVGYNPYQLYFEEKDI